MEIHVISLIAPSRLISILLVVFGMNVLEASAIFTQISGELFTNPNITPRDRNLVVRRHIEELLQLHDISLDATLLDVNRYSNGCKL
jgi:hypothetical protein